MTDFGGKSEEPTVFAGNERRKYQRYPVNQDTLMYNNDSLAEILDISFGGFVCKGQVGSDDQQALLTDVELLNCTIGQNINGLRCRKVRSHRAIQDAESAGYLSSDYGFEFVQLSPGQVTELRRFIESCTGNTSLKVIFS